ncbi:MAG: NlpC/P60 family protein [Bacillota bacterium]|nr:NlpC/P60 family protein [Bacillota bacterium]
MKKGIRIFAAVLVITSVINKPVFAVTLTKQLQNQKNQLQSVKNELNKAQMDTFEIEQRLEIFDNEIETIMDEIQANKNTINNVKQEISATEKELQQSEQDIKKEQELFSNRIRANYISGIEGYLNFLLESNGFSNFLSRIEILKSIIELDKMVTTNIKVKQINLNNKKVELKNQNDRLMVLNNENNIKLDKLKTDKSEQNKLIDEAKKKEKLYSSAVDAAQSKLNETLKKIEATRKSVPKNAPSRGAVKISSSAVVAYAANFLGTPYLWGGTTPAGFDCSGFTQYVYRHFGISLGRTTYNQINNGYAVSRGQLRPGDLVFYGKGGSPTHMGIYIGNGMYIHSPRTGDVIKISSYNRPDYITARRVMR